MTMVIEEGEFNQKISAYFLAVKKKLGEKKGKGKKREENRRNKRPHNFT